MIPLLTYDLTIFFFFAGPIEVATKPALLWMSHEGPIASHRYTFSKMSDTIKAALKYM